MTVPRALAGRHESRNAVPSCSVSCTAPGSTEASTSTERNTSTAGASCGNSPERAARYELPGCSPANAVGCARSRASMPIFHGMANVVPNCPVHACTRSPAAGSTATMPPRATNDASIAHWPAFRSWGSAITIASDTAAVRASSATGSTCVTSMVAGSPGASARATQSPAGSLSSALAASNERRSTTATRRRSVGASTVARASSTGCASGEMETTTARRSVDAGSAGRSMMVTLVLRSRSPAPSSSARSTGAVMVGPATRTVVFSGPSPRSRRTVMRSDAGASGPVPASRSASTPVTCRFAPCPAGGFVAAIDTSAPSLPIFGNGGIAPTDPARNALASRISRWVPADSSFESTVDAASMAAGMSHADSVAPMLVSRCSAPR